MEVTRAYIRIRGFDEDSAAIYEKLRLPDAKIWRKGQQLTPRQTNGAVDNGWELQSALPDDSEMISHICHLVETMESRQTTLESIKGDPEQLSFELVCVVESENANPSFSVPNTVLNKIAALGFSLEVDLYVID